MKIGITRAEWEKFMDYEYARRNHPCRKCKTNKASCTGCNDQKAWDKRMSEIGVKKEEYTGTIADCIKAFWDACDANLEAEHARNEAKRRTDEYQRLQEMIEVE